MSKLGLTFEVKIYIHFSNEETKVKIISIPFNQTTTEGLLWAENYAMDPGQPKEFIPPSQVSPTRARL